LFYAETGSLGKELSCVGRITSQKGLRQVSKVDVSGTAPLLFQTKILTGKRMAEKKPFHLHCGRAIKSD
jgi:hypothetical protein